MGPASAFHFLDPAFYVVFMILPTSFGLLGIDCAGGLLGLREWARKGTLFLATVPVLVCVLLVLFHPSAVFFPQTQAREQYLLLEEVFILRFLCVCSLS